MKKMAIKARELKGADLQAFIEAKGITLICPSCNDDQVSIISQGPHDPLHILAVPRVHPEYIAGEALEMIGLTCKNCGYVRMFVARSVVEWKEQESPDEE